MLQKKEPPSDVNSYRLISLLPAFGKVLERGILARLLSYPRVQNESQITNSASEMGTAPLKSCTASESLTWMVSSGRISGYSAGFFLQAPTYEDSPVIQIPWLKHFVPHPKVVD